MQPVSLVERDPEAAVPEVLGLEDVAIEAHPASTAPSYYARMEFLLNSAKYMTGASLGAMAFGSLISWGIGAEIATYSSPCIDEPSNRAVDACARNSHQAKNGAGFGALTAGFIAGSFAGLFAYDKGVARRDDLTFVQGFGDACKVTASLLPSTRH